MLATLVLAGNFRERNGQQTKLAAVTAWERRDSSDDVETVIKAKDSCGVP